MRNKSIMAGFVFVLALAWCVTAYAADSGSGGGFWASVGGFLYNALPWNWGNWWGK